jgi:hypothetical protein
MDTPASCGVLVAKESAMSDARETIYRDDLQNLLNTTVDDKLHDMGLVVAWGYATVMPRMIVPEGECNWTYDWEPTDTEADDIARSVIEEFQQRYDMVAR